MNSEDRLLGAHQKDVAALLAIAADDAFQHMNAADVDLIDADHAQEQKALLGLILMAAHDELFHLRRGAEIQVAPDLQDAQLGTGGRCWTLCWRTMCLKCSSGTTEWTCGRLVRQM